MTGIEKIIAGTAFEIVARCFSSDNDSDRNSFRLKNLTRSEAMEFLNLWKALSSERGLERVTLLVASDSHEEFPLEFRADPEHSITYYRNNNEHGLVYIETKVESDEQGLKNIFTLRDVNFLDGTFDEPGAFLVPEEMVRQALKSAGSPHPDGFELLRDRLVEVLRELKVAEMTIPVRKYASFLVAAAMEVVSKTGVLSPDETDALVGRCLIHLDMFPDEQWRLDGARVSRRLSLNLLRSELAASPSADLDPEKIAQDCERTKFVDEAGEPYTASDMAHWREECSGYCLDRSREQRERIPYRIFEQVFNKDVKGLPLGQRLAEEIAIADPQRKSEFDELGVESGLDGRSVDDARKFLESEPSDSSMLPLKSLLSTPTLRRIEKLASPAVERIRNPLVKLSQVVTSFRESKTDLEDGNFRVELRLGAGVSEQHASSLGLFAFLFGRTLQDVCDSLTDELCSFSLSVDDRLIRQSPVPPVKEEVDPDSDTSGDSEEEGVAWPPVPLEFYLVDVDGGRELDSEVAIEWLPDDLPYLALFWISVCGEDRGALDAELHAPPNRAGEEWIMQVVHRMLPLDKEAAKPVRPAILQHSLIQRLFSLRTRFREEASRDGLSFALLNDVFDEWSALVTDARECFVPDGDAPTGMIEFLNADCIQKFDGDRTLMLQSHPLKLRWISAYLNKSHKLAAEALAGVLTLNKENEGLYLNWIQGLSPHQQPAIHSAADGHILFAAGERGWTEIFQRADSTGDASSEDRVHSSIVVELARQITAYLHAHPYKTDGLRILVVTGGGSSLPADIVDTVRKGEFKNLSLTIDLVTHRRHWAEAARQFEQVDTENRLTGDGALFPPVQLNLHDLEKVKEDASTALENQIFDLAIVPQFLDDNINADAKTEDEAASFGKFDPLLDDPTYIASGTGASALWVSLRPKTADISLSSWSTLVVRHERRNPVAADRPESTDFIDLRINFHNTARFFGELHKRSHWVITVERHITREQIERLETRPEVLSLRDNIGPGGLFTLIVSSNAGKRFVIDRLTRKLKRIAASIGREELADQNAEQLAHKIYDEARQISPRLTLDALGISRVTEEILGLSVARRVADSTVPVTVSNGFVAWISLDEHPEWFTSATAMRADMVRLAVNLVNDRLSVNVLVLESKLRRTGFDAHGAEQVRKTLQLFDAVFPDDPQLDPMDGRLWRDLFLSVVDTVSERAILIKYGENSDQPASRSRIPEEIRSRFRDADFSSVAVRGLYSICEYSHARGMVLELYDKDDRVTIAQTGGSALLDPTPDLGAPVQSEHGAQGVEMSGGEGPSDEDTDVRDPVVSSEQEPETAVDLNEFDCTSFVENDPYVGATRRHLSSEELDRRYQVLLDTFAQYGVNVNKTAPDVDYAIEGPASILYRVRPGRGVAPSKLYGQHDALKLALELDSSQEIRFDIDKGYVTIDVPKLDEDRYFVTAPDLWSRWERPESGLLVPLGEDRFGNVVEIDFTSSNSPHLLIGGTTGSGKSEALNTILAGITTHYSPEEVRLHLIDPKGTELEHFSTCEHVEGEIGWIEEDAIEILARAVDEMQARYARFKGAKVRSLGDYNMKVSKAERLPRWVIVLDEYADLTSEPEQKKTIEGHLRRLAQKARAAGIHVIIATQKPDATVISTNLRSNLPAQLALRVKSATESRVIMDDSGAESLTGMGDAFLKESGVLTRVQCAKV